MNSLEDQAVMYKKHCIEHFIISNSSVRMKDKLQI